MYADPAYMSNPRQWYQPGMLSDQHWGYGGSPPNIQQYPQPSPRAPGPQMQTNFLMGPDVPSVQPNHHNGYPIAGWNDSPHMMHFTQHSVDCVSPTAQFMSQTRHQQSSYGAHMAYTASPMMSKLPAMGYRYPISPVTPKTHADGPTQPLQHLLPLSPNIARRGPPRKPKRSGHAVWVGNIPIGASIQALKDHFSRHATDDIESVFLMGKSNCAFVNYRTKEACEAAVERFNHSMFGNVRLLCRMRRDTQNREQSKSPVTDSDVSCPNDSLVPSESQESTEILANGLNGLRVKEIEDLETVGSEQTVEHQPKQSLDVTPVAKLPARYFILKSLTREDLNDSLQKGTWETQAHNQHFLHEAFKAAKDVYLIFSVNKSGEYFGYARMAGSPFDIDSSRRSSRRCSHEHIEGLRIVRTPATATAPMGHITDDAARGTLFWEAERGGSPQSDGSPLSEIDGTYSSTCRPFKIEWQSVRKVSFQRTKGMKNAWNAGKDVKVARDGTELETGLGERILGLFHEDGECLEERRTV